MLITAKCTGQGAGTGSFTGSVLRERGSRLCRDSRDSSRVSTASGCGDLSVQADRAGLFRLTLPFLTHVYVKV